jgi:anti-sigma regulatory factor (Ser/Thr protein kinase)
LFDAERDAPAVIDPVANLSIRADSGESRRASEWLDEAGSARGVPPDPLWRLDLCLTEALANVLAYGGASAAASPIHLRLDVRRGASGGTASVTVSDAGAAFDPLKFQPKARARTLAEAELGGHGLLLLRRFADALDHSYSEGRNRLTIYVRWNQDKAP